MSLELRAFQKRYSGLEIRAEFKVQPGERVVLSGPSGSGKTTLFRFIAGLDLEAQGSLWLAGREITGLPPEKRNIGIVFQEKHIRL